MTKGIYAGALWLEITPKEELNIGLVELSKEDLQDDTKDYSLDVSLRINKWYYPTSRIMFEFNLGLIRIYLDYNTINKKESKIGIVPLWKEHYKWQEDQIIQENE